MPDYDEEKIAAAQAAWREQDMQTFGKSDEESTKRRSNALLDLLAAHIPIEKEAENS